MDPRDSPRVDLGGFGMRLHHAAIIARADVRDVGKRRIFVRRSPARYPSRLRSGDDRLVLLSVA